LGVELGKSLGNDPAFVPVMVEGKHHVVGAHSQRRNFEVLDAWRCDALATAIEIVRQEAGDAALERRQLGTGRHVRRIRFK
jgi:hypothetical protein